MSDLKPLSHTKLLALIALSLIVGMAAGIVTSYLVDPPEPVEIHTAPPSHRRLP